MDPQGQIKFDNLQIACAGQSMRLQFSVSSFTVLSDPFDVHGDPVSLEMHNFPSTRTENAGVILAESPAVMLLDSVGIRTSTYINLSRNVKICVF